MPRVLRTGPARRTHATTQMERTLLGVSVLQEGDMVPNLNTGKAELGPPQGGPILPGRRKTFKSQEQTTPKPSASLPRPWE